MDDRNFDVEDILRKYGAKIENQISTTDIGDLNYSKSYLKFKDERITEFNRYEKWAHSLGEIIKIKLNKKDEQIIEEELKFAHLDVEPWQALGLAVMSFLTVFFLGVLISVAVVFLGSGGFADFPILFFIL